MTQKATPLQSQAGRLSFPGKRPIGLKDVPEIETWPWDMRITQWILVLPRASPLQERAIP